MINNRPLPDFGALFYENPLRSCRWCGRVLSVRRFWTQGGATVCPHCDVSHDDPNCSDCYRIMFYDGGSR